MNTHQSGGTPDKPSVEDILAAVVREESLAHDPPEQVLAAFRATRDTGALSARTRRGDDWRPHRPHRLTKRAWRATAGAFLASLTLGGVAIATFGVPHVPGGPTPGPETRPSRTAPAPSTGSGTPRQPPTGATPVSPSPVPGLPPRSKATEAHCRSYERVTGRGHALDAAAWQRLVRAAGGEQRVPAYCAALLAQTSPPEKTTPNKTPKKTPEDKSGKDPAETGKGQQQKAS